MKAEIETEISGNLARAVPGRRDSFGQSWLAFRFTWGGPTLSHLDRPMWLMFVPTQCALVTSLHELYPACWCFAGFRGQGLPAGECRGVVGEAGRSQQQLRGHVWGGGLGLQGTASTGGGSWQVSVRRAACLGVYLHSLPRVYYVFH